MKRFMILLALGLGTVLAQGGSSFASLTISAAGDEEFDIATGITTLADGGEVRDRDSSIVLTAPWIRYQVDEFIDTRDATVQGPFGTVTGEEVFVDIEAGRLSASGSLQLSSRNLLVSGEELTYHADVGVVDVEGNVTATDPVFTARRVLYHTRSGTVLLVGPYSFDDGFMQLSASSADSLLELRRPAEEPAEGEEFFFEVSSTPRPETLALFGSWVQ